MPKVAVIALGGNALTRSGQDGAYEQQRRNALAMARSVLAIRQAGWSVVLVHGNGPQVGNLAIQQEEGRRLVPAQPLFSLGAMTQGEIGSLLCLALRALDADVDTAALITHVVVAPNDPAFGRPTKPIGPFFSPARAAELAVARGWSVAEDSGRGFRRLVPSPQPVEAVETAAIKSLVAGGTVVIAAGGGGVPVARRNAALTGVEAVIDKDYVAGHLASALGAQALVFVTDVPRLMLDFGTSTERALDELDVTTAERYLGEGHFPAGSMGPKVHAATQFLRAGGELTVISTAQSAALTLDPPGDTTGTGAGDVLGTRIMATNRTARITS